MERRDFVQHGAGTTLLGLMAAAGLLPSLAAAQAAPTWNKSAFEGKSLAEVVKALGGAAPAESREIVLQVPEIADNGAVVRIGAQSRLAGTTQLALLVDKNPNALAAVFDLPQGTEADVTVNVKMSQSSNVYAVARVGDKFHYAVREVKVTIGGCGV